MTELSSSIIIGISTGLLTGIISGAIIADYYRRKDNKEKFNKDFREASKKLLEVRELLNYCYENFDNAKELFITFEFKKFFILRQYRYALGEIYNNKYSNKDTKFKPIINDISESLSSIEKLVESAKLTKGALEIFSKSGLNLNIEMFKTKGYKILELLKMKVEIAPPKAKKNNIPV